MLKLLTRQEEGEEKERLSGLSESKNSLKNELRLIFTTKVDSKLKIAAVTAAVASLSIMGRVALQSVPSVEPILPLAIGLGFYYDWKYGVSAGASAFFVSNFFVWGFQGPWTIFQCLGAGLGAASGDLVSKVSGSNKKGKKMFFLSLVTGTALYELTVNLSSLIYFPWGLSLGPVYFLAAVPFAAIHLVSSFGFGSIIYALRAKLKQFSGRDKLEILRIRDRSSHRSDR